MSAETFLKAWLENDAEVQALAGKRIYPQVLPQGAGLPAVTYYRTGQGSVKSLSGLSGLSRVPMTVDCWGLSYTDAKALADAIQGNKSNPKLDGYRGTLGGVRVQACFCQSAVDFRERPVHGDETGVPHVTLDFDITFEDV